MKPTTTYAKNAGGALEQVHLFQDFTYQLHHGAVHTTGAESTHHIGANPFGSRVNFLHV
jgi:hypothetical protein